AVQSITDVPDSELRRILETTKTIAVVGISGRTGRPAHTVPAEMQGRGYRIIPVNPNATEVLGEKAFPDLLHVPDPIDTVMLFVPGEAVPPIVEQAIKKEAKVVWMQEGIVNEQAAHQARSAGLTVVMDRCMSRTWQRLLGHPRSS